MRVLNIAFVCSAIMLLSAATGASAQTISYGEAVGQLTAACGADIEKHCKGVKPGGGRMDACLAKNSGKISGACNNTYKAALASLQKRHQAQQAAPQLCAAEIKRLCSNFRQGNARILRCLIRQDNVKKVSNKCNQAITDAGWR